MKSTNKHSAVKHLIMVLHRDLGYFFAGVVIIYALSGIFMNHRNTINPQYTIEISEIALPSDFPTDHLQVTDSHVQALANQLGRDDLIKHYYTKGKLKLLFKGGSSLTADLARGEGTYENISRRILVGDMVRLHYNPGHWWTVFSDIFAASLIIITLTGLFILKGRHGIIGRGGILLLLGLLAPILMLCL